MSKTSIVVNFTGFLGSQAGVIDGVLETGHSISNYKNDKWDVTFSGASAFSNMLSHLE